MVEPTESEDLRELDRFCAAMIAIRSEIDRVAAGEWSAEASPLRFAPHTAEDLVAEKWDRAYPRELAAFPSEGLRVTKYFPPVGRIDAAAGDATSSARAPRSRSSRPPSAERRAVATAGGSGGQAAPGRGTSVSEHARYDTSSPHSPGVERPALAVRFEQPAGGDVPVGRAVPDHGDELRRGRPELPPDHGQPQHGRVADEPDARRHRGADADRDAPDHEVGGDGQPHAGQHRRAGRAGGPRAHAAGRDAEQPAHDGPAPPHDPETMDVLSSIPRALGPLGQVADLAGGFFGSRGLGTFGGTGRPPSSASGTSQPPVVVEAVVVEEGSPPPARPRWSRTAPSTQDTFRRSAAKHPAPKEPAPREADHRQEGHEAHHRQGHGQEGTGQAGAGQEDAGHEVSGQEGAGEAVHRQEGRAAEDGGEAGGAQEGRPPNRAAQPALARARPAERDAPVVTRDSPCIVWRVGSASRPSSLAQAVSTSVMAKPRSSSGTSRAVRPWHLDHEAGGARFEEVGDDGQHNGSSIVRVVDGRLQHLRGVGVEEALRAGVDDQRRAQPCAASRSTASGGAPSHGGTGHRPATATRTRRGPAGDQRGQATRPPAPARRWPTGSRRASTVASRARGIRGNPRGGRRRPS